MSPFGLLLRAGLALVALGSVVLLGLSVAGRIGYPFALEWMESGSLEQVRRLVAGEPLYTAPSLGYIPYIYPPLYFWLSALAAKVMGVSFVPLRAVSLLASLATAALIARWGARESGSAFWGLVSAGLFLACYQIAGTWYDLGRVDNLFLLLALGALYVLRFHESARGHVVAGALMALAFLTKQIALALSAPLVLYALASRPRAGLAFAAAAFLPMGLSVWALDGAFGGWYSFYAFESLGAHSLVWPHLVQFWTRDLFAPLGLAVSLAFLWLLTLAFSRDRRFGFYLAMGVGLVGVAWVSRLNFGGAENVLIPAFAYVALLAGLGASTLLAHAQRLLAPGREAIQAFVLLACLVQFLGLAYRPATVTPTAGDLAAGRQLVAALKAIPGDVWVPYHPELAVMAGKAPKAHGMAVVELLWKQGPVKDGVERDLKRAIAEGRFKAVVLDEGWFPPQLGAAIAARYRPDGPLLNDRDVFWPVSGMRTRPTTLHRLKAPAR